MEYEAQVVDANRENPGTGVLGRMLDKLAEAGYSVGPFGINSNADILEGRATVVNFLLFRHRK